MTKFETLKWYISNLRPGKVRLLFKHVHAFAPYDKRIAGFKYAIYYGRLLFEHSKYVDGVMDKEERSRRVDRIIHEYTCPEDRFEYISILKDLRNGVEKANNCGFFSVGNNEKQNEIEAANYQKAMDSLNIMIKALEIYPTIWKAVFLRS